VLLNTLDSIVELCTDKAWDVRETPTLFLQKMNSSEHFLSIGSRSTSTNSYVMQMRIPRSSLN
jgi:hypothetical protein